MFCSIPVPPVPKSREGFGGLFAGVQDRQAVATLLRAWCAGGGGGAVWSRACSHFSCCRACLGALLLVSKLGGGTES